ncbi:hypothetical protein NP603_11335 [Methylomonas sp. SURF-1]|uniref:Class I SAM-dependent methyltransferase n=1 Tax=Methylomonas aurea TaxID=2952224 RepID=A0ABT1UHJ4_9GAMM|nr:hypothetical protein [Methylomonas sp. SURF-1]MCQ8181703.1 hypothetical protein [Methylomonas sp. SURF-1]
MFKNKYFSSSLIYVLKYIKYALLAFLCDYKLSVVWYSLRYAFPVLRFYQNEKRDPIIDEKPWMSFPVIELLDKILKKDQMVFEYGSGGSTLFFSRRVKLVVSVEHNREWYELVESEIKARKLRNVKYEIIPPTSYSDYSRDLASVASSYVSDDKASEGLRFKDYAAAIDCYPDSYFDLVVVDGRVRPSCIHHAQNKVKRGGILLLDQSERKHYSKIIGDLMGTGNWKKKSITGPLAYGLHFTEATFFYRK